MKSPLLMIKTPLLLVSVVLFSPFAFAQTNPVPVRVTQAVDMRNIVTLRGNVHPLARPEFDQGIAPDDLPTERILLVLQRGADQEAALRQLLDDQQSKSSPRFHQWLTPEQFGRQFGPTDSDIQAVTDWLTDQGFQVNHVAKGRTVIEFSGTAGMVRQVLGAEIHKFRVNGEDYWANSNDPQIPAALAPVVAGFASLNNFPLHPASQIVGPFSRSLVTGEVKPLFTVNYNGTFYDLGPTDFATIYNVLPLWNAGIDGTGQTIAIISDSNINIQDVRDFRNIFGLPARDPQIIVNGTDPGITSNEGEADLDTEWSGAVAKGATIDLVVSQDTSTTAGTTLSTEYIIDNNLAPIMSSSYGACEQFLGSGPSALIYNIREQGAAEGITILQSAGDTGSARCDQGLGEIAAEFGLTVNGWASTPFNVAVGGTDFNDVGNWSQYWNSTNSSTSLSSALSYIPESTWNGSCAASGQPSSCANATSTTGGVNKRVGGGGPSTCGIWNANGSCSGYPKPAWQTGTGVPNDGVRDVPDISLFASAGANDSAYVVCRADEIPVGESSCKLGTNWYFVASGGTSAGAPSFAGIMAMVNQKTGERQGIANYVLYPLAAQPGASCTSNAAAVSNANCIFYDVVVGNNSVACVAGSPACSNQTTSGYGILVSPVDNVTPAWTTTAGYDLATGLGSVNAANLVNNWASVGLSDFSLAANPASISIPAPGQTGAATITLTPVNGFVGLVSLSVASGCPTGATCTVSSPVNLTSPATATSTLTVTTTGSSSVPPVGRIRIPPGLHLPVGRLWLLAGSLALAVLLGLCAMRRRPAALLFATTLVVAGVWGACGGGSGGGVGPGPILGTSVSLSPTSLTFSSQQTGTTSAAQSVTLTNTGAATLTITNLSLTGTNPGDFAQTNTCGSSVAVGANCSISVKFTPTAAGARNASVSINDNTSTSPQTVTLSGTGTAPTPPGVYPVVVNAVSGTAAQSLTVNVTVE
jgi:hypothetical protein